MTGASAAIAARRSVRTFDGSPPGRDERARIERLLAGPHPVPFGNRVRFALLDAAAGAARLGTYGVIRGARAFIAGAVTDGPGALEDLGFALERTVLELTLLGLGTCWLAGTFRRAGFAGRMALQPGEILPAVTPVGHAAARPSLIDAAFRVGAGSARRRDWATLFTVDREEAGAWAPCLEAVRLGPSATNGQPWRIAGEPVGPVFHLGILAPAGGRSPRRLDAGIAMCHFALVAAERGLPGAWGPPAAGAARAFTGTGTVPVATWNPA